MMPPFAPPQPSAPVSQARPTVDNSLVTPALGSALLAASPDCVKVVGLDGTLMAVAGAGMELLEIDDPASVVGKPWTSLYPEAARPSVERALMDALNAGKARFTALCPTTKGRLKWWDVIITLMYAADGTPLQFLSVSRDITALKASEASLRISEQRFRALADNMSQLAWMADKTGSIFWYNHRWFAYTGTTLPDMVGWGWRKVHHPDHVDRVVTKIDAHFKSGEPWEDLFPLRGCDGQYRWFLSRANALRDEAGNITLWCGTNTDITDQRNSSQRLRQLARILEMSHEAILIWDFDDGILQWNRGCEQLYGFTRQEALGGVTHDLLKSRHPMPRADFMRTLLDAGSWSGELCHIAKDGREVWVDSRHEIIRVGGRNLVLESNRDITERRAADDLRNLLVAELNHRVKNTLAIAQSIVKQSSRNATDVESFVASFKGRLQSLSSAHNVLTDAHWAGAGVRELIASQLAVTAGEGRQVTLTGPEAFVAPQTALQLTLIIYELATNALQYGALSTPRGAVEVTWTVSHDTNGLASAPDEAPCLHLTWRETGGPPVTPPRALGFGLTLIDRSGRLPHLATKVSFDPTGVVCTIDAKLPDAARGGQPLFNPGRLMTPMPAARPDCDARPAHRRRVLLAIGDPVEALEVDEALSDEGFLTLGPAVTSEAAASSASADEFEMALVDLDMPGLVAMGLLDTLRRRGARIVALTRDPHRFEGESRGGALVLSKPLDIAAVVVALRTKTCPDR